MSDKKFLAVGKGRSICKSSTSLRLFNNLIHDGRKVDFWNKFTSTVEMSNKDKALTVLQLAFQTCSATLEALADSQTRVQSDTDASLDTRLKDFTSLLSLLHQNTTKLAIALKPSNPTYLAALTPAKELAAHTDALVSCACSVDGGDYGAALAREVRWSAEEVTDSLRSLLGMYIKHAQAQAPAGGSNGGPGEMYLIKTGVIHEAIDRAREISRTNHAAVQKRWKSVLGGVGDCVNEVQEMVEDEENEDDDARKNAGEGLEDLDDDDGWGMLSGAPLSSEKSVKATKEELARLNSTHHLLKFAHALLKHVSAVFLGPSLSFTYRSSTLDGLLSCAEALLKASDDLVSALYVPQNPETVSIRLKSFTTHINELHNILFSFGLAASPTRLSGPVGDADPVSGLTQKTTSLKLNGLSDDGNTWLIKERKWFDVCFSQISKSADTAEVTLTVISGFKPVLLIMQSSAPFECCLVCRAMYKFLSEQDVTSDTDYVLENNVSGSTGPAMKALDLFKCEFGAGHEVKSHS
ncbi:hypothetical protein DFH11DRAFT_1541823 [Phellopilus nigrolimitatus]|nr:hypothetical protein DFH11DRAFT_1541823 [Phellopilus nigrolimitatus]